MLCCSLCISVARIALVKPAKADEVSNQIISMAQRGALTEKISEDRLKQMIESAGQQQTSKAPKITFQRKKYAAGGDDDDDEEYDL